jgi:hypothetical protein
MKLLLLLASVFLATNASSDEGLEITEQVEEVSNLSAEEIKYPVTEIIDFEELMETSGREGHSGSVILVCGKDSKMENHCENITLAFKQFKTWFPEFKQQFIYYDLNHADFRIMGYFDIERIPHIMYIKDRRIYTYRYKTFSINSLASFIKFFEDNPDAMWRHFPTKPRSKLDYWMEGLYRLEDRIYILSNGMTWAINAVYAVFGVLFCMLLYGIFMFFKEVLTGKVYEHLTPDGDKPSSQDPHNSDPSSQSKPQNSEDLKVKRE